MGYASGAVSAQTNYHRPDSLGGVGTLNAASGIVVASCLGLLSIGQVLGQTGAGSETSWIRLVAGLVGLLFAGTGVAQMVIGFRLLGPAPPPHELRKRLSTVLMVALAGGASGGVMAACGMYVIVSSRNSPESLGFFVGMLMMFPAVVPFLGLGVSYRAWLRTRSPSAGE